MPMSKELFWITMVLACLASGKAESRTAQCDPVDYVDTNIGGIGHLLTATEPIVSLPHSMVQIAPVVTPSVKDRYLADRIYGFPLAAPFHMYGRLPVPCYLVPIHNEIVTDPARAAALYDHTMETAKPYYYSVELMESGIQVEFTVTEHAIYYRFHLPAHSRINLQVFCRNGELGLIDSARLAGQGTVPHVFYRKPVFFHMELSQPARKIRRWNSSQQPGDNRNLTTKQLGMALQYETSLAQIVDARVGISYISSEQARANLEREIPQWDFPAIKNRARQVWNQALGRIAITGGTDQQLTSFYTAFYRALLHMVNVDEYGQYHSPYDHKTHQTEGNGFYVGDGAWDTYRSLHPLQLMIDPQRQLQMVRNIITGYEQGGWLTNSSFIDTAGGLMIGQHTHAIITDTFAKGYRDFDIVKAYQGMCKNIFEGTRIPNRQGVRTDLDSVYLEKGFFPALAIGETETIHEISKFSRRQAVSVTLENCYDDWCVAQLARELGKSDDYATLIKHARFYQNLFNTKTSFMEPRNSHGHWIQVDPVLGGGQGGRDFYTECNAWIYTFHVQHDIDGLISLFGGPASMAAKLDQLYVEQYKGPKWIFLRQFPDQTGLIGNYGHGNEPAFHIPYLYNYCGQPWKTQRRLRQIMEIWYPPTSLGLSGDDDLGALSSWLVFSAMGFYPVCPGRPYYDLGSPLFPKVSIQLPNGKHFVVEAHDASRQNQYIQSATLNGQPLNKPWIEHSAVANGGHLVMEMGPRPNTQWGVSCVKSPSRIE